MSKVTRRCFSPEYKERSVARLSEPCATLGGVALGLGITPTQLKTWDLELEAAGSATAITTQKAAAAELADLRRDAIWNRRPARGPIHHSDRGMHYACGDDCKLLRLHGIKPYQGSQEVSRKGICLDDAPMESFFSSLKTELEHRTQFTTRREARAALLESIEIF